MCGIDQRLEIIGSTVHAVRSKRQNTIIAPVSSPGEVRNWHQFDSSEACSYDVVEFFDRGSKGAFGRERSSMQFQKHAFVPWPAFPFGGGPGERLIDHLARAVYILRLKARGGIGYLQLVVDAKLIKGTGAGIGSCDFKPAASVSAIGQAPSANSVTDCAAGAHSRNVTPFTSMRGPNCRAVFTEDLQRP